jgi:hypothetical protein
MGHFSYIGKETKYITKAFKDTDWELHLKLISLLVTLKYKDKDNLNKYDKIGVYKLTCIDCGMKYVGRTDRPFSVQFQDHARWFKYINNESKFAQLLCDNRHRMGSMDEIMDLLNSRKKGRHLKTMEKILYI